MIVNHLARLLAARHISVLELQRMTGVPRGSLHALYHGRSTRADFGTLDAICTALGCGVGDLLEHVPGSPIMSDDLRFGARSIYGASTRRGLVEVTVGAETVLVEPSKARELAAGLIEAATAAEGDEVLMRVLDRAGMSPQRAAQVLMAMRMEREIVERKARAEARRQIAEDQEHPDTTD